jgi:allene oxide cyclase
MKILLIIGAVVATVAASAALAGGRTSAATTIHVVEHADTDVVANGTASDRLGNVLTFANPVYDAADARKVGTDEGYCVRTVRGKTWECTWTTFLAGGQLSVQGPFSDTGPTKLAITGGTGAYAGARGVMELRYHDAKGTKFDFVFRLG